MIFAKRKKQYLRAMAAQDDASNATAEFRAALRKETERHARAIHDLLGDLIPARDGGANEGDDVSTGE